MGHKKRTIYVAVAAVGNPPATAFTMRENGQVLDPDVPIRFNKDVDGLRKVDHYRIRFEIQNPGRTNLRFIPHIRDVMWAHKSTECPTSFCEMPGEFWTDKIDKDREWIDVINMNMKPEAFKFTLNFADKSIQSPTPGDYVPFDPTGGNEDSGGGGSGFTVSYAAITVGTVAFAAFTAYGFGLLGEPGFMLGTRIVLVAVGTLCFAAFAAYVSGLFDR